MLRSDSSGEFRISADRNGVILGRAGNMTFGVAKRVARGAGYLPRQAVSDPLRRSSPPLMPAPK